MSSSIDTMASLFTSQAITAWQAQNRRVDEIVNKLTEEELYRETAPGRNTGMYLFGHLIGVNDGIIKLFGAGERLFSHLEEPFVNSPDKSGHTFPSLAELKTNWIKLNEVLNAHFLAMKAEDWAGPHTAVSPEDFSKQPYRNKLNVLMSRTSHQAYHVGQMTYLLTK